ncbi:MAG: isoprenylcysteine carboxylmethyltransferase family protein [Planctomycetes bacterium]|nr:isoprenylcysteine carboxylmethyltransferase family protein [Planctomycetota bacterium]
MDTYFKLRGYIPIPIYLAIFLLRSEKFDEETTLAFIVGPLLIVFGEFLRVWARKYIGRSSDTRKLKASTLITGGPFAIVRNPIYSGNYLAAVGCLVASENYYLLAPVAALLGIHYVCVIQSEERLLLSIYGGAYAEYCLSVPRFAPGLSRARVQSEAVVSTARALWYDRRQILGLAVCAALLILKDYFDFGLVYS